MTETLEHMLVLLTFSPTTPVLRNTPVLKPPTTSSCRGALLPPSSAFFPISPPGPPGTRSASSAGSFPPCSHLSAVTEPPSSVQHYSTATARLTLTHDFPAGTGAAALVDVTLVLENLTEEHTRVGEWLNVIGYVSAPGPPSRRPDDHAVPVQALLVWSAGLLDLQRYERSLAAMTSSNAV